MRDAVIGLVPVIDQALADCVGVVDQALLEPVALMRNRILARLDYPDDVLLTALAGGTGSGKSSLFNAIAGEEVAATGGVRPTTSQPKALVPAPRASALAGYLDLIGIGDRILHRGHDWLCLIDLPDTDSVEVDHRQRVDSLLPQLDCVVWVVDPEKYRDASLHHGYLAPMADYGDQFVFVLNQCDRLGDDELSQVEADLSAALLADGIEHPTVIATAAQPPAGPVIGIDQLLSHLRQDLGGSVYEKAMVDLRNGCSSLLEALGGGSGVEFDQRWILVADQAIAGVVAGDLSGASRILVAFLDEVSYEIGGEVGRAVGEVALEAPQVVLGLGAWTGDEGSPRRRWWRRNSQAAGPDTRHLELMESLEREVATPVKEILGKRAKAQASVTELALALNHLTPLPG
jgi:hypothetical protein